MSAGDGWTGRRRSLVAAAALVIALGVGALGSRWSTGQACSFGSLAIGVPLPEPSAAGPVDNVDADVIALVAEGAEVGGGAVALRVHTRPSRDLPARVLAAAGRSARPRAAGSRAAGSRAAGSRADQSIELMVDREDVARAARAIGALPGVERVMLAGGDPADGSGPPQPTAAAAADSVAGSTPTPNPLPRPAAAGPSQTLVAIARQLSAAGEASAPAATSVTVSPGCEPGPAG